MTLNKRKNPIIFLTFLTLGFLDGKANPSQSNPGLFRFSQLQPGAMLLDMLELFKKERKKKDKF